MTLYAVEWWKIHYLWNGCKCKNVLCLMSNLFTCKFVNKAYLRQIHITFADTGAKCAKRITIIFFQFVIFSTLIKIET
jgi:hypothetical protein